MSQVFLHLAILTVSSIQVSPAVALDKLKEDWLQYEKECNHNNTRAPPSTGLVCIRNFDLYACWPDGWPNTTVGVRCPWYLPWHNEVHNGMVYLDCQHNGQWVSDKNTSECELNTPSQIQQQFYGQILSRFQIIYTLGYSLSLVALVLALGTLIFFRKLHCMRNNIHMNLFASFILRALSVLIKDALMEDPGLKIRHQDRDFTRDIITPVDLLVNNETTVACRIAMVMMHFSIMANSYWLLVEGIYLHNLLVIVVFNERNFFNIYLCIGWGAPLLFLLPWVTAKYLYENEKCWELNVNMNYWWIIRSPILLAVVTNFLIFIHIIKILVSKLRAHQMRYTDYKFRLAKSTLSLIPLLGIHQMVFVFVLDESSENSLILRFTKVAIDLLVTSFQGLLVAILYCFFNKEVQSEVLKNWKRWKLGRNIEEEYRHTYSQPSHIKSGSLLNPTQRLPNHLPDITTTTSTAGAANSHAAAAALAVPEEKHRLMVCCGGGGGGGGGGGSGSCCGKARSDRRSAHEGNASSYTLAEDISLTEKSQGYEVTDGDSDGGSNAETHL
ncbi:glucagon receptor isoform X2 [Gadus chalcogrammus]|nr:glucagon receptor isoform X2 [Gadus chalcogrammus]